MFLKLEKKNFIFMHCWFKLNGQPKWKVLIVNSTKTAYMGIEEEMGDPTNPTHEPPKKVKRGLWGKKWEEEKAKQQGAATKITESFEDILARKEETYVKRSTIKEACKAERFNMLMTATKKILKP